VCADGIWLQNRCIADLQGLTVAPDSECPAGRDVFSGAPVAAAAPRTLMRPIAVSPRDLTKYASQGYVFRGIAPSAARSSGGSSAAAAAPAPPAGVVEAGTRFWYTAGPAATAAAHGAPK
jgi:hypothetical protein